MTYLLITRFYFTSFYVCWNCDVNRTSATGCFEIFNFVARLRDYLLKNYHYYRESNATDTYNLPGISCNFTRIPVSFVLLVKRIVTRDSLMLQSGWKQLCVARLLMRNSLLFQLAILLPTSLISVHRMQFFLSFAPTIENSNFLFPIFLYVSYMFKHLFNVKSTWSKPRTNAWPCIGKHGFRTLKRLQRREERNAWST